MNVLLVAALSLQMAPEVQRPKAAAAPVAAEPVAAEPVAAEPVAAEPVVAEPVAEEPVAAPPEATPEETPTEATSVEAEPEPKPKGETFQVVEGNRQTSAPYYTSKDLDALRRRHGLPPEAPADTRKVRWRCAIADPLCGFNVEVQAMSAVAPRFRQGDVREKNAKKWTSGRAQYDVWVNIPVLTEARGRTKYTRMTLGPKAGAIFSDTGDTWGNIGMVGRYWLGHGRFAPTIEFSSALAFKLAHRPTSDLGGEKPRYEMQRGPVGISADVGVGIGGFGALVFGGQYDSPLAREDVPERFRTQAAGMLYFGFRGNILWGAPAAAAVATHGLTQRLARAPG